MLTKPNPTSCIETTTTKLPFRLPRYVYNLLTMFERENFEAFVVGGCVRDSLLGRKPKDWDIATSALPYEILALAKKYRYKTLQHGMRYGTISILVPKNTRTKRQTIESTTQTKNTAQEHVCHHCVEITTFRCDSAYSDNRHPTQVTYTTSLQSDLKRRDFTCNALAYNPALITTFARSTHRQQLYAKYQAHQKNIYNGIYDTSSGIADIASGILRCVGEAKQRFKEDALRILRALRFRAAFGFALESSTKTALIANAHNLESISAERKLSEWSRILLAPYAAKAICDYWGVWARVFTHFRTPLVFLDTLQHTKQAALYAHFCSHLEILHKQINNTASRTAYAHKTFTHKKSLTASQFTPEFMQTFCVRFAFWLYFLSKVQTFVQAHTLHQNTSHATRIPHNMEVSLDTEQICATLTQLKLPKQSAQCIMLLLTYAHTPLDSNTIVIKHLARKIGVDNLFVLLAFLPLIMPKKQPIIAKMAQTLHAILANNECYSLKQLAINGTDIQALARKHQIHLLGKDIGAILEKVLECVIQGKVANTKNALEKKALGMIL